MIELSHLVKKFGDLTAVNDLSLTVGRTKIPAAEISVIAARVVFCAGIVSKSLSGADFL